MGDYSDDFGFTNNSNVTVVKSGDYSTNGDYSAKTSTDGGNIGYIRFKLNTHELQGETITFSANIKTSEPLILGIYDYYNNTAHLTKINIPSNSDGNFNVSIAVDSDSTSLFFDIQSTTTNIVIFYTDNWSLTAQ